jgi:hypothetical protein
VAAAALTVPGCGSDSGVPGGGETNATLCQDGKDNDKDGKIDCADTDCKGFTFCQKTSESSATSCQDGTDNDGDGKIDCEDPECQDYTFCKKIESTATLCQDGKDNDADGKTDCDDPDCKGFTFCQNAENTPTLCADNKDNDGDGKIDCDDPDCQGYYFCAKREDTAALCQDAKDNDGDGLIDCADSDCKGFTFCVSTQEYTPGACQDGKDNDNDGKTDCADPDCAGYYFCKKVEDTAALCQDGKDNDGDGKIDCDDSDCQGFYFCVKSENTAALCQDGKDNDGDGKTDCADPDCGAFSFCAKVENTATLCTDGKDNDGDGKIDCADTDCSVFSFCSKTEATAAACKDGKDNDGDGKIDCDDPDCQGYTFCIKAENTPALCTDKKDNDGDGKIDCADTDCSGYYFCIKTENTAAACADKKDNDGDGKIDCADPDCGVFSFCASSTESSRAQCQDGKDNDGDGKIDCADNGCWAWHFCAHYSGYPVTDAFGATWDGQSRASNTYANAKAACAKLGGRLPTVTELYRNNTASGSSTISPPNATEYLWTQIADYRSKYRVTVRLSDGNISDQLETNKSYYRCIWPPTVPAKGFSDGRCYGKPGDTCYNLETHYNVDKWDRPALDFAAAVNECKFYNATVPDVLDWAWVITSGLPNGSNNFLWASNAMYWHSGGHGHAGIRWSGIGEHGWYYNASTFGSVAYVYSRYRFRCKGLEKPSNFVAPSATCNGGCTKATLRGSEIWADSKDRGTADYKSAFATCRALGGDLPNVEEATNLMHHGWAGGSNNWIWTSDALYWHSGGYGHPLVRWSGSGTEYWSFYGWSTNASLAAGTGKYRYRCIWRTRYKPWPKCSTGQIIRLNLGVASCAAGGAGTSNGKAVSEKKDAWGNAWDGAERTAKTYAAADTSCKSLGGRLPTASEIYRVRSAGNPHGSVGTSSSTNYIWTSTPTYRVGYINTARISDGAVSQYSVTTTRTYRCIWTEKRSNVLDNTNCYGPPNNECFKTSDGMTIDAYDRPPLDITGAMSDCLTDSGRLADARELNRLIHQGLSNGSGNWMWLNEAVYWYSGGYGYALTKWSGVGSTSYDYISGSGYLAAGTGKYRFRCIYSPYVR